MTDSLFLQEIVTGELGVGVGGTKLRNCLHFCKAWVVCPKRLEIAPGTLVNYYQFDQSLQEGRGF